MRRSLASYALKLYGFPLSQPTRSVELMLKASKTPYQYVLCDAIKGENRKPAFLAEFPCGLVPVIDDSGFKLSESAAILCYVAENYGPAAFLGGNSQHRARVNEWLHWHHANTRFSTKGVLHNIVLPKIFPKMALGADERLKAGLKTYTAAVKHMNKTLEKSEFLAGDSQITVADLLLLSEVDQLTAFGIFDYTPFPHVTRWVRSCESALIGYNDVYDPVVKIAKELGFPLKQA